MNTPLTSSTLLGTPYENCLTPADLEEIRLDCHVASFQNREIIFRQQTPISHFLFIRSGLVKIYKEERNKRNFILKIARPGEYIGLLSAFSDSSHQYSASAVGVADIGFIKKSVLDAIIKRNGEYAVKLIQTLSEEGLYIFERLISQTQKQLPGRIADVILYFSETIFGSSDFEFPLTRRELAELAGTTKESFIRTLTEFKKRSHYQSGRFKSQYQQYENCSYLERVGIKSIR